MKEFNKTDKIKEKKRKKLNERMKPWKKEAYVRNVFYAYVRMELQR